MKMPQFFSAFISHVYRYVVASCLCIEVKVVVTVKVIRKSSGEPIKGKKVALGIDALLSGGVTKGEWTDSNGEAHFDVKPNYGKVFVDGSTEHKGYLSGRIVVYL